MKKNVFEVLSERGFVRQTIYEEDLVKKLSSESVTFYVGFDPTADSLHIGHYIPIMAMAHMQRCGHNPIALIGGGTAMIGDPSNRSDMRKMMSVETIEHNCECFRTQMARFFRFEGENAAIMVNNADWLLKLNFIDFLRDFGVNFSVNKMLTADCYKSRLESGLTFLEFSYMLMQSYDFYELHKKHNVTLQLGGNDQWSNMLGGVDLIRRKDNVDAFCMTFAILEKSDGTKMGKTSGGALWLDANKTSPYDFYQYFRSIEDVKVRECFCLLTFLELDEIDELTKYNDERLNSAKERLAYEITSIVHGQEIAQNCRKQARAAFGGNLEDMPSVDIVGGLDLGVIDLLVMVGQAGSKGEARRLIDGGGVSINETKVASSSAVIGDFVDNNTFVLHKGKKVHLCVNLKA